MTEQLNTYCFHIKLCDNRDDLHYRGVNFGKIETLELIFAFSLIQEEIQETICHLVDTKKGKASNFILVTARVENVA